MKILSLLMMGVVLLITGCGSSDPSGGAGGSSRINAEQGKEMMSDGQEYVLVDVRTQEEYDSGHIQGAILIPVDELQTRAVDELTNQDVRIIIYCRSGNRSATAARILVNLGYTHVYDMGGVLDWPYELVH